MLSKAKITKYSIVLIIVVLGIFMFLSWRGTQKTAKVSNPTQKSVEVKAPTLKAKPSDNSVAVSSNTSNSTASKAQEKTLTAQEVQAIAVKSNLNNYVLKVIHTYDVGKYPYLLNEDYEHYNGVTENIVYQGSLIAKANPDGSRSSHCVGLTYEVFFKAMQQRNKEAGISSNNFNNMSIDNMKDFMLTWYNALGTPKSQGDQLAGAIVKYGLGTRVTRLEDAEAGDFIDFSRTQSGHTAVFINWLKDNEGNIVGFRYWSTQGSTNGIAYKQEYFIGNSQGNFKGTVNRNQLYIGRVGAVSNYKRF